MFNKKNDLIILAAMLMVILFSMGFMIYKRSNPTENINTIVQQSKSIEVEDIERDLNNTELENIDKELQDIEKELEQAY